MRVALSRRKHWLRNIALLVLPGLEAVVLSLTLGIAIAKLGASLQPVQLDNGLSIIRSNCRRVKLKLEQELARHNFPMRATRVIYLVARLAG
jgi:hypothetical protein